MNGETFVCPRCGTRTVNPRDVAEGYCARCHRNTAPAPPVQGLRRHQLRRLPALNDDELAVLYEVLDAACRAPRATDEERWPTLNALRTAVGEARGPV